MRRETDGGSEAADDAVHYQGDDPGRCADVFQEALYAGLYPCTEERVVRPVGNHTAQRGNGNIVDNEHDRREDRQGQPAVGNRLVDLIGGGELAGAFLLVTAPEDRRYVDIAFVRNNAFGIVVQFLLGSFNVFFNMVKH